jgi:ABC-type glycerol-3-phosphate transport system substrate-binding protein
MQASRRQVIRRGLGLLAGAAIAPLVAACGGSAPVPTSAPAKPAADAGAQGAATKPPADKPAATGGSTPATAAGGSTPAAAAAPAKAPTGVEIVYLNQSRGQLKAMTTLAEKYTSEKGVKITIDSPGPVDYPKKLQAASQAGNMPDTYYAIGAADMAPYYKAGFALNIKPELEKGWKKNFQPVILDLLEWKEGNAFGVAPGIYHAPWEVISFAILYNPALYEKAKLDPKKTPTTPQELMDALKALKAAGIGAFATGDTQIPDLIQSYVSNYLTDQEIDATHAGKSPWKSDPYKKTVQLFADMRDAGLIFNNSLNANAPDLEKSFFNVNELGTFYTGVYSIPVQVTTAPNFTAYSAYPVPKAPDAKNDVRSQGGPGKNGVINPKSKVVDEAVKYIQWLTEKEQSAVFMEVVPLVSPNPAADATKIQPQLKVFAAQLEKLQKVQTPRTGPVNEALYKGVQSLLLKEKTVDQVLDDADKAQKG